ncbi:T9SS type A sorting domain-containing protein [candidate division KSB1 bacterium]|nr:T9SS type A sorting domain-containing protein [candidate division KSB1 bacterium]
MKKRLLFAIILSPLLLFSEPCKLQIGTNLAGPSDWGSEWPLNNIMKYCRKWMTHNTVWVEGGENPWETHYEDFVEFDENGYPLEMPVHFAEAETTQAVRTVWAHTQALPLGRYVLLYDGTGRLDIYFDAENISYSTGRIEFDLKHNDNILGLSILESKRGDHIRNIRLFLPGTENSESPWCSEWLEKLDPFNTLRFMDWGYTNNSTLSKWENRPKVENYSYTLDGMPYELMIDICNYKSADAWVCIPHLADDDYIRNLAHLFRDSLHPQLKIYVEYSNENWNWMFDQTHYLYDNGDQSVEWPERIVPFIQNALDIWTTEFEGQTDRLVRVVGVQGAWQDVSNRIVLNMRPGSFDAFSPAAYFGFTEAGIAALQNLGASTTAEDVIFWAREGMLFSAFEWLQTQFTELAEKKNIPMIYYEGGQHLTPEPFGSDQTYNQALMDAQTHPAMYDLYCQWLDSLRTLVRQDQPTLFMNFSFISPKSGKYGSWGVLENQFEQFPPYRNSAPKYQAILDNLCTEDTGIKKQTVRRFILYKNYPNPFNPVTTFEYTLESAASVDFTIYNINGQRIITLVKNFQPAGFYKFTWNASGYASGVYIYKIQINKNFQTGKCLYLP